MPSTRGMPFAVVRLRSGGGGRIERATKTVAGAPYPSCMGTERGVLVAAACVDELPEPRRVWLRWRYGLTHSGQELEAVLRQRAAQPCPDWHPQTANPQPAAILGDDGRWHLRGHEQWLCTWTREVAADASQVPHDEFCPWWTDGATYRVSPPDGRVGGGGLSDSVQVSWTVAMTAEETDPTSVPPRQRCRSARWPPYSAAKSQVLKIRSRLISEFGPQCAGCGMRAGVAVDHDHLSWIVRGLLCAECNTHIDDCPHLAGCPWATYLATPPAAALALRYPRPDRRAVQRHQRKVAVLGYDPLAHLPEWQARHWPASNSRA